MLFPRLPRLALRRFSCVRVGHSVGRLAHRPYPARRLDKVRSRMKHVETHGLICAWVINFFYFNNGGSKNASTAACRFAPEAVAGLVLAAKSQAARDGPFKVVDLRQLAEEQRMVGGSTRPTAKRMRS